ncbi:hypothetical protein BDN72DRAFT_804059 [Pluteus cervinus]|uniref:Uncharacterized protein n=1 Tax=Pluteus cervinus TaxID=181527 RepID=A0ACD3AB41_9AGAR|nr:hypothetical protein BDN72DRAFT_804059 [Pluteus cervinus]
MAEDQAQSTIQPQSIYFGYGSNLWLDQMKRRCPGSRFIGVGYLTDWTWFINTRGYANVKKSSADVVYGAMYLLTEEDEALLDGFEGVPTSYVKERHPVVYLGDEDFGNLVGEHRVVEALVYVDVYRLKEGPPKAEYICRMNEGINDALKSGVPKEYIEKYLRPYIPPIDNTPN